MVAISPPKSTLFAGEMQVFVAKVFGDGDKTVTWSVDEEGGGSITDLGVYTAPKIQGVYHVIATSTADPRNEPLQWLRYLPIAIRLALW